MDYQFSPKVDQLVQQHMATGDYFSEDEVLLDALQSLSQRKVEIAAIQEGIDDMETGQFRSLDEADAALRRKHGFPEEA